LAEVFCRQARLRADHLFRELRRNTDSRDVKLARAVSEDRYTFLEAGIMPPPSEGEWTTTWEPGPATVPDVRRRIPRPAA
jgi:hypothetical protein